MTVKWNGHTRLDWESFKWKKKLIHRKILRKMYDPLCLRMKEEYWTSQVKSSQEFFTVNWKCRPDAKISITCIILTKNIQLKIGNVQLLQWSTSNFEIKSKVERIKNKNPEHNYFGQTSKICVVSSPQKTATSKFNMT